MTSIEWTDVSWNPTRGCSRISEGCRNCYAERMAARNLPEMRSPTTGKPFAHMTERGPRWTGKVELIPSKLDEPLRWRKPRRVFVNSMSDLFHEALPFHMIASVYGVMAACQQHTFQVLTKRPARRLEFHRWLLDNLGICSTPALRCAWHAEGVFKELHDDSDPYRTFARVPWSDDPERRCPWPLPNVWEGVSVEDQATADERIPLLLQTPAAVRFISGEPLLEEVDLHLGRDTLDRWSAAPPIDQVIVGGESGPGARPFHAGWARSIKRQCREAMTAFFMKQMGANVRERNDLLATDRPAPFRELWPEPEEGWHDGNIEHNPDGWREEYQGAPVRIRLKDRKGGDPAEWPEDLRVREFPL